MSAEELTGLLPFIIIALTATGVMVSIAFYRKHEAAFGLTLTGLAAAFASVFPALSLAPLEATPLLLLDSFSIFIIGLIIASTFAVVLLSYGYNKGRGERSEEYYVLTLLAALGAIVLAGSSHFASFFLGLEVLSVSLYALIAYVRTSVKGNEAGIKYLILAGASSAFLLFGMALVYAKTGTMEFASMAERSAGDAEILLLAGLGMIIVGAGFKLAVVPFHMWTPDIYEGAPAPVSAFIATVSKGAMFALLLRFFILIDVRSNWLLFLVFTAIAIASMTAGNFLALFQNNIKRVLAYSSIAHLGYLLVAFLASGALAATAVGFYLVAYFITILGAFGIVTVLSGKDGDRELLDDYRGLAWEHPWLAGAFTAMLLSLAGIPLTVGFIGKFYLVTAGVNSALWLLVLVLALNSALSIYYYLRIVSALYTSPAEEKIIETVPKLPLAGGFVMAVLTLLLVWFGVYPSPLIRLIEITFASL